MKETLKNLSEKANLQSTENKYLTFWADNQLFGMPIINIEQIVGVQHITEIPEFPDYAKGIINLRGNMIPVIDVRIRLQKQPIPYGERTCIIVTKINDKLMGLIVDAVDEVASITSENISAPPQVSKDDVDTYLTGIAKLDDKVILLLDSEKIFNNERE